ncbi:hypothetical protein GCM10010211_76840 [Streptomyces albospinus]|uniref:Uncharacterized protein n=1 Tax=Streptomyces albospinus TaxID=285515 RepID=A0ABQ2VMN8_9ACTN|nr:hypothetical protein [Streptomyces albospinus]GGU98150.1 hypothetical protein GCM10010211_76840 [Streptomyces albospinus]
MSETTTYPAPSQEGCGAHKFAAEGTRPWEPGTGGGSALSTQYPDEKRYLATTDGCLVCADAGDAAVTAARAGAVPVSRDVKSAAAPPGCPPSATVETAAHGSASGIVVECVEERSRLRVHAVSEGSEPSWDVRFPRHILRPGVRYAVDGRSPASGGFHRVRREIRQLR